MDAVYLYTSLIEIDNPHAALTAYNLGNDTRAVSVHSNQDFQQCLVANLAQTIETSRLSYYLQ